MRSLFTAAAAAALLASTAGAQVGYPPERSPYRDVEFRQELTLLTGYYAASADPAKVAPQSGPMLGVRYDVRVGGPASLTARVARVFSERNVVNPALNPGAGRAVGTESWPLYLADMGLTLALTGQKSLHHLVPVVSGGAGIASDFRAADVGGFRVGTAFALNFGGGVRWVPGGSFQLRADVTDHLFQIGYPSSYFFATSSGGKAVLGESQSRSVWKHNAAITLGASYLFFR